MVAANLSDDFSFISLYFALLGKPVTIYAYECRCVSGRWKLHYKLRKRDSCDREHFSGRTYNSLWVYWVFGMEYPKQTKDIFNFIECCLLKMRNIKPTRCVSSLITKLATAWIVSYCKETKFLFILKFGQYCYLFSIHSSYFFGSVETKVIKLLF